MRFFYIALFIFLSTYTFSQSHLYKFKIGGVDDAQELKTVLDLCNKIFDVTPEYDPYTNYYNVKSETDIDYVLLTGKMAAAGFEVTMFLREEDGVVNQTKEEE
jgi:hypothetical protein